MNWRAFWKAFASAFNVFGPLRPFESPYPEFKTAAEAIAHDWKMVGQDLRKAIEKVKAEEGLK